MGLCLRRARQEYKLSEEKVKMMNQTYNNV